MHKIVKSFAKSVCASGGRFPCESSRSVGVAVRGIFGGRREQLRSGSLNAVFLYFNK